MGKTQSKRSVDITTEAKKIPEEEVTGKLEKIEDLDQKQVNGDASSQENVESEKKEGDETENDKDLTTEKSGGESAAQDGGGDTNTGQSNENAVESAPKDDDSAKDGNKAPEEISPLTEENSKKPKKEKVKKKWSFRSISFGKKDKQKPAKSEETANETTAATNGDNAVQVGEETSDKNQTDETAGDSKVTSNDKPAENGDTSDKELNGQKTSTSITPNEGQPTKEIAANESTTNITNNTTETTNSALPEKNTNTSTENDQTEKQITNTATKLAVENPESSPAILSNGDAVENKDTETADEQKDQGADKTSDIPENIKSIPKAVSELADNNGVHQNGTSTNGDELETENESKSQVEVIFQTDQAAHTDDLVTLNTATTFSSPKTTPILRPDPNEKNLMNIENSRENVITDSHNTQKFEETFLAAESAASIVLDGALRAIEPVSTSKTSDIQPLGVVNVDTGNEEPYEQGSHSNDKNTAQSFAENHCEDADKDVSRAVNDVPLANDESPKPPPLPVSPPPSQVSVFAFNDNNQAEEDRNCSNGQTDIVEKKISQPATEEKSSNKATCDPSSSTFDIVSVNSMQVSESESVNAVENPENSEAPREEENHIIIETSKNDSILSSPIDENSENEFVKAATSVVDEISEKAVELIQHQIHMQPQPTEIVPDDITSAEIGDDIIALNNDLKTDNTASNINNLIEDIKDNYISTYANCTREVIDDIKTLNINCGDISSIKNETPLDVESHSIDCIQMTDKHVVEGENEISTDICNQSVASVNDNQN